MKISEDVAGVLSTLDIHGNEARITAGHLDRKLYLAVNACLEAAGGTWRRGRKAHCFDADPTDLIDGMLATGEVRTLRDAQVELGWFPTPPEVARDVVRRAQIGKGDLVLEPSAGEGALVLEALKAGVKRVVAVEIDPGRASVCEKRVPKKDADRFAIYCDDFLRSEKLPKLIERPTKIVMNPPFRRRLDVQHVAAAMMVLRPGGRIVAIMSRGVCWARDRSTTRFRECVLDLGGTFTDLPDDAFLPATAVRTTVCELTIPIKAALPRFVA